ncbi:MAG: hypothetical protein ACMUHM_03130 [Thermoplasmatota archaeon]
MERDGNRVYVPEEFDLWLERSIITREQYEALKKGFVSDIWQAIDYFHQEGMISDLQYERLRLRYVPKEIKRWYELGIIDESQYTIMKQGYNRPPLEIIEELRARGVLRNDQAYLLSAMYEFGEPEIPSEEEMRIEPEPPSLIQEEDEYDWTEEDLKVLMTELGKDKTKEEEEVEGWPEEMDYHFEMELPPPKASKTREAPGEEITSKREKEERTPILAPPSGIEAKKKEKKKVDEVQKESFFKFNQLVFFITGSILFLLAVFATIAYTWEMMSNLGRGLLFIGISCLVAASGLIMRFKDFNKYLEIITYHASMIMFAVGIVFLIAGSLDIEGLKQGVIILSLLIPVMVIIVGFHFNYRSISLVATLGYLFASVNSFVMWPEGSIVSNLILLPVSVILLYVVRKGKGVLRTGPLMKLSEGYAEREPPDIAFIYTWISMSVLFFLIAQSLTVANAGQGTTIAWIISSSGLVVLAALFLFGYGIKDPGIQISAFVALLVDAGFQASTVQGYGQSGGSWAAMAVAFPFFIMAFIMGKGRSEKNERWVYDIMLWLSAVVLTLAIMGTSSLPFWDMHTHYSVLFGLFSVAALLMSLAYKRTEMAVYGSILLACTVSYFSLFKFEAASFLVFGIPFIMAVLIGRENTRKYLEVPFVILFGLNYVFLLVGPLQPFGAIESGLEPVIDWWKIGITLTFSIILFYWGLGGGYKLRMGSGAVIYLVSTGIAMWVRGDLFIMVFFLLTAGPALLRRSPYLRKRMDLPPRAENTFQNLLLLAGTVLFVSMWFSPVFAPLKDAGIEWSWWKSAVALSFSLIYLLWSIISVRRFHFLAGSVFYTSVLMFNMVYHSEIFALGLIALPLIVLVVERLKRTVRDITKLDVHGYMFLLSFILTGAFVCVLAVKPIEPIVDLGYASWRTLAWWRTAISMGLTMTVLAWGLLKRSNYYFFLGTCFLCANSIILAVSFSELFLLAPLALPVILLIKEQLFGGIGRKRTFRSYIKDGFRFLRSSLDDDETIGAGSRTGPPMYWFYGHLFPLILIPLALSLLVPTVYPLHDVPLHTVYWKYLLLAALCSPVFIWSIRSRLPSAICISATLFSIGTVIVSIYKLELLAFALVLPPVLYHLIPPSRKVKDEERKDSFGWAFHLAYMPALIIGYLLLWIVPFEAEIDLGLGTTSYLVFKGAVTLAYGIILAAMAVFKENKAYLIIGAGMVQLSIMFLGVSFFEPILFLLLAIPLLLDRLFRERGLVPRSPEFSSFLRSARPLFLLSLIAGFVLIYIRTYDPIFDIWGDGTSFWAYKVSLLSVYSLIVLLNAYLYRKEPVDALVGSFLFSAGLITISFVLFSPALFLFLPVLYLMGHPGLLERIEDIPTRRFLKGLYRGLLVPISIGFILIWFVPFYPLISVTFDTTGYWTMTCVAGALFGILLYLWGLYRRENTYIISSLVFLSLSFIVLSRSLLPFVILTLLIVPFLIDLAKGSIRASRRDEEPKRPPLEIFASVFHLFTAIGFASLWLPPLKPVLSVEAWSVEYWAVKGVLGAVYSFAFFSRGIYKKDTASVVISLVMVMITAMVLTISIMPVFALGILTVPLLIDSARKRLKGEDDEISKGATVLKVFQGIYLVAVLIGFVLCWMPSVNNLIGLEPWSAPYLLFSSVLAIVYVGFMTYCCVRGDRPYHFLTANILLLVTAFIMALVLSEPFALLAFLVPLVHILSRDLLNTRSFSEAAARISKAFFPRDVQDTEEPRSSPKEIDRSFYGTFKHAFLVVSVMFFGLLFLMVWTRPLLPLIGMDADLHLWYIVATMFVFGIIPILWGLKGILRAHVLFGVLFVVVDSWVLFLNQIKGLGVVVSLFFTAVMFLAAGLFFVWASKKQKTVGL